MAQRTSWGDGKLCYEIVPFSMPKLAMDERPRDPGPVSFDGAVRDERSGGMEEFKTIIKYLVGKLAPDEQAELAKLLDKSDASDLPSLAADAKKGLIAFDRLPARVQRQLSTPSRAHEADHISSFNERFPEAARMRVL